MTPEQFVQVADAFPDAALLVSREGTVLAANSAVTQLGYSPPSLTGQTLAEVAATPAATVRDYLRLCARSRQPVVGSLDLRNGDGQDISCRCYGAVVYHDPAGAQTRLLLRLARKDAEPSRFAILNQKIEELTREVHRRQQAEEELRGAVERHKIMEGHLASLVEASATLTSSLEPAAVLASILRLAEQLLPADAYSVWRYHAPSNKWQIAAAAGLSEQYQLDTIRVLEQTPQMLETTVVADDVFALPLLAERKEQYRAEGIRSMLVAPLRIRGQVCGTLVVYHRRPHHFDDIEARVATALANLSAATLGSADLYEVQRDSEARFRGLMEQAPFSVQLFSPDGRTVRVNRAWEELWGVTLDQIADYNILRDPQLEAKGVAPYIHRAFAGAAVHIPAIEYDPNETIPDRTRYADARRWVSAVAYPLRDQAGRLREVVLIHEDMTARKRAEEALRESEEKFRLLADTIPQLAWMARPDGHIFWYNRRWYEYTGTTAEQMEGWGWQSVHDPAMLPQVLERWTGSIHSGAPFDMVFPLKGADGRFRPFLTRVNPLRDEAGRIVYWFGTNTDVSAIKQMEDQLREADRRKDEFLATLAHELRNPLAPIRYALHILKLPGADAAIRERGRQMMERQVEHMARLVDDLMDVSRIMRGKIDLRKEPVELAIVIARAVETAQPVIDAEGHELKLALAPEPLQVDGDLVRLAQVVANLLNNAAKFTERGGRITLTLQREGNAAAIRVRDTGIGISADMLPRIFDMFVQAERRLKNAQGGLGIGLSLVQGLVALHGGTVEAHSAGPGTGSEFVVHLPLLARAANEVPATSSDLPVPALPRRQVLVVDDSTDAADSLALLLRLRGQDVRVAYDGPSALALAEATPPDVAFLDLGMPTMNGHELAVRFRAHPLLNRVLLVAVTGLGQPEDRHRSREAGFDHHLTKPVDPEELVRLLSAR
jgi:PAS domain S-box-containing protein